MQILLIHFLFFLSGISGLVYQVVWVRQFGNIFGNTVYSAATVSAVFLCGLGIGSFWVGRWSDRRYRSDPSAPLRAYGWFEIAIAAFGLAIALALPALEPLATAVSAYEVGPEGWFELTLGSHLFRHAMAVVLLAPITFLMGGTLTLLIRYLVRRDLSRAAWRVGALFGINTGGAAAGAFASDFALIPELGILGAQWVAIAINAVAGSGALLLARGRGPRDERGERVERLQPGVGSASAGHAGARRVAYTAIALFLTGLAAMGMEILWFRFLITSIGPYRSVFSLLLTVILVGICAGSFLGGFAHRRLGRPIPLFFAAETLFVISALLALAWFDHDYAARALLQLHEVYRGSSGLGRLAVESVHSLRPILAVVGIPALLMGCAFPLGNAIVQQLEDRVGARAGTLYLLNTLGNVCGSLVTGFVLLPLLGMQSSVLILASVAALGLVPLYAIQRAETADEASRTCSRVPVACLIALIIAISDWALLPANRLLQSAFPSDPITDRQLLALSEGINETVAVIDDPQQIRLLYTNGFPMSSSHPSAQRYMRLFAHLPLLQLQEPERVLVICLGVGNTLHAAALHPSIELLEVADLSKNVVRHAHYFSAANENIIDDPRVAVFINDGRHHLRMREDAYYDLITLEPPPIAAAGVASLYSREFYELASEKLRDGGYITQWLPAYQVSGAATLSIIRAFIDVFPDAVLLSGHQRELILLGSNGGAIELDIRTVSDNLERNRRLQRALESIWVDSLTALVGTFVADARTLESATRGVAPLTDDRPITEYSSRTALFETRLPRSIFAPSKVASWCPACFRDGRPLRQLEDLDHYVSALGSCYASDAFLEFSRLPQSLADEQPAATALPDVLENPDVQRVIRNSLYLRYVFLGPAYDDPALARRYTPCAIPTDKRWLFQ